jgi:CO dehydrogenase/acetyl-CoA synthase beta subunit
VLDHVHDVKVIGSDESEMTEENQEPYYIVYDREGSANSAGYHIISYR